jgi:hypothetical protein
VISIFTAVIPGEAPPFVNGKSASPRGAELVFYLIVGNLTLRRSAATKCDKDEIEQEDFCL